MPNVAVIVRRATRSDAPAIAALLAEGSLTPDREDSASPELYGDALARVRARGGDVLVAQVDTEVVGVCEVLLLEHIQHAGGHVAEVESVHVNDRHRGQGVGGALLEAAVEWAGAAGCYRVQLTSNLVRTDAHRFYERHGFVASHLGFKRLLDADLVAQLDSRRGPASPPRISPLPESQRSDVQRELLDRINVGGPLGEANIFTTLVRAPALFKQWLRFGGALLSGSLPPRDRELLILRTGVNCDAPYEWGQHVRLGRQVGLTDDEIARVAIGADAPGWNAEDRLVLLGADELHESYTLHDELYDQLAVRYDEVQLIEFAMVVGHYHLLAMTLNMLGTELDDGLETLPG